VQGGEKNNGKDCYHMITTIMAPHSSLTVQSHVILTTI